VIRYLYKRAILTKFRSANWSQEIFRGCSEMWRTLWGFRDVWQSVTGEGVSKLAKNSMTYFMDGPQRTGLKLSTMTWWIIKLWQGAIGSITFSKGAMPWKGLEPQPCKQSQKSWDCCSCGDFNWLCVFEISPTDEELQLYTRWRYLFLIQL